MDKRTIHDDESHAHFLTFSCYRRRRLLDHDRAKRIVLGVLNDQLERRDAACVGFVVMPDHVHAIVWFPRPGQLQVFIQQWKRLSSHHIGRWAREELTGYAQHIKPDDPFWQAKYYSFNLFNAEKIREKLTYMHQNPVRLGGTVEACHWLGRCLFGLFSDDGPFDASRQFLPPRIVGQQRHPPIARKCQLM